MDAKIILAWAALAGTAFGQSADDFARRAREKMDQGDFRGALEEYTNAIGLGSRRCELYSGRAAAWERIGKTSEAIQDLTRAIEIHPECYEAYFARGWLQLGPAVAGARRDFEAALQYASPVWKDWLPCMKLYDQTGGLVEDGPAARAAHERGAALYQKRDYRGAEAEFGEAIRLAPGVGAYWQNRGVCRRLSGRFREAVSDLTAAVKLDERNANAWRNLGLCRYGLLEWTAAVEAIEKAIELNPNLEKDLGPKLDEARRWAERRQK